MRLRPITLTLAKPAVPVGGEPIIRRILAWLARERVTDVVVNLHYLPATIAAVVGDGRDLGVRVRYSWEQPVVLGSAGGPRKALPIIGAAAFFIANGDTLTDVSLAPLARQHAATRAMATMALVPNREPDRYGGVRIDGEGRVIGFTPRGAAAAGSYHFIGVQVVQAEAFATLSETEPSKTVGGLYDRLIASQPGSIRGYVCDARFWDIGTPEDLAATDLAFGQMQA